MTQDRPPLGIALMLGFCLIAPMGDSLAKYLGQSMQIGQLVTVRFVIQALLMLPFVWAMGQSLRMPGWAYRLILIRAVLHVAGVGAMFLSLQFLPLADAVAIAFVMPFIMLLLGKVYLDEEVGTRRLAACAVGFVGTLLVVQPSFAKVGLPALLPVFVAVVFAFFMLVTRKLAKATDAVAMQCVTGFMASTVLIPLVLIAPSMGWTPLVLTWPEATSTLWLLALLGVLGSVGHLLMAWSLRYAPAATLAPMQYLEIPFATLIGWLVFRDFPNGLALIGIVITIASGLYVIHRERVTAKSAP